MRQLPLLVPLGERETPTDFLSRLAMRNCRADMYRLARDLDADALRVIAGDHGAIARLAEAGAADLGALRREAFTCQARSTTVTYRGHRFSRMLQVNRIWARMCPACMRDDLDSHSFRPEARPHRRSHWIVASIRTCDRHGRSLVSLGTQEGSGRLHDTSLLVAKALPRLREIEQAAASRTPSAFERFVLDRLDARPSDPWLDTLPLHVVMQASALLGMASEHGPGARLSALGDDQVWEAEAAGFESLRAGETGIRACLDRMLARERVGQRGVGPNVVYGQLYDWMAHSTRDKDFDPIREIVTRHVLDNLPIAPGAKLFGRKVTHRRVHSVTSASVEYGLHRPKLRAMLAETGWIIDDPKVMPDWLTFDAVKATPFLRDAKSALKLNRALEFINAPDHHADFLIASGLLKVWIRAKPGALKDHAFLPRDLDEFLLSVMHRADERHSADPAFTDLSTAHRKAMCSVETILRMIVDGRLPRVGKRIGERGYRSILVDPAEVDALVARPTLNGYSAEDVASLLSTKLDIVHGLVAAGRLEFEIGRHPKNNRRMKVLLKPSVDRFERDHVAGRAIYREIGPDLVRHRLNEAGIEASFVIRSRSSREDFYRRSEIPPEFLS